MNSNHTSIGSHGLENVNEKGVEAINILRSHHLKALLTFFNHRDKVTWRSFNEQKTLFQLDKMVTNNMKFIIDTKVVDCEIPNDLQ